MPDWPAVCSTCGIDATDRQPGTTCPECGGPARTFSVHLTGEMGAPHSMLGFKARHGAPGQIGPFLEAKTGDSFNRDTGRWLELEQVVDHEQGRYRKRLVDKDTGEVIRGEDVPLSEHRTGTPRKPG